MNSALPSLLAPYAPTTWNMEADPATWIWDDVPVLPPFTLVDNNGLAKQQTAARVCYDFQALYVRFQ